MSKDRDMDRKKVLLRNKSPSLSLLMKRYRSCKEGKNHLTAALSRAKKSSCQVGKSRVSALLSTQSLFRLSAKAC